MNGWHLSRNQWCNRSSHALTWLGCNVPSNSIELAPVFHHRAQIHQWKEPSNKAQWQCVNERTNQKCAWYSCAWVGVGGSRSFWCSLACSQGKRNVTCWLWFWTSNQCKFTFLSSRSRENVGPGWLVILLGALGLERATHAEEPTQLSLGWIQANGTGEWW